MTAHDDDSQVSGEKRSRRAVLEAIGAGTVPVAGLSAAPVTVLGREGTKTSITILASGDRAAKSVEVSKRWYDHTRHVSKVRDALANDLRTQSNVVAVGVKSGDRKIGNLRSELVRVNIEPNSSRANIPDERNGVPVEVTEHGRSTQTSGCYTIGDQKVHGGLSGWGDLSSENDEIVEGTLCCRVYLDGILSVTSHRTRGRQNRNKTRWNPE